MTTDRTTGRVDAERKLASAGAYTPPARRSEATAAGVGSQAQDEPTQHPGGWLARSAVLLFLAAAGFERTKFFHGDPPGQFSILKLLWGVDRTAFYYLAGLDLLAAIAGVAGFVFFGRFVLALARRVRSRPFYTSEFAAAIAKYAAAPRRGRTKVISHWHH